MSHRISIQNGKAEFAYTGQEPWHGLGERVAEHLTPAAAVERVLPWTVRLEPQLYRFNGELKVSPKGRSIIREDNGVELGRATGTYVPIQNKQAADVADALIAEGAKCVDTIGALDDGGRCFMLLALDRTGFEVKPGDTVLPYFLLRWGHDGQTTLAGKLTNIRVVCHNTLTAAGRAFSFDVKHTASAKLRIEDAREALGVARKAYVAARDQYRALAAAPIAPQAAVDYFAGVFAAPVAPETPDKAYEERLAKWEAVQRRLLALYSGEGKGALQAGPTAWGAYNAVTEYLDHVYPVLQDGKVSAARQESVLFGSYADVRGIAYQDALTLAGV